MKEERGDFMHLTMSLAAGYFSFLRIDDGPRSFCYL